MALVTCLDGSQQVDNPGCLVNGPIACTRGLMFDSAAWHKAAKGWACEPQVAGHPDPAHSSCRVLQDVSAVKKQKALGLPNSLEITCNGKTAFFTSFLSREDAYRLITGLWAQQKCVLASGRGGMDVCLPALHLLPSLASVSITVI